MMPSVPFSFVGLRKWNLGGSLAPRVHPLLLIELSVRILFLVFFGRDPAVFVVTSPSPLRYLFGKR